MTGTSNAHRVQFGASASCGFAGGEAPDGFLAGSRDFLQPARTTASPELTTPAGRLSAKKQFWAQHPPAPHSHSPPPPPISLYASVFLSIAQTTLLPSGKRANKERDSWFLFTPLRRQHWVTFLCREVCFVFLSPMKSHKQGGVTPGCKTTRVSLFAAAAHSGPMMFTVVQVRSRGIQPAGST